MPPLSPSEIDQAVCDRVTGWVCDVELWASTTYQGNEIVREGLMYRCDLFGGECPDHRPKYSTEIADAMGLVDFVNNGLGYWPFRGLFDERVHSKTLARQICDRALEAVEASLEPTQT